MRLASNSIADLISFYHAELANFYERSEIDAILSLALKHYLGFSKTDVFVKRRENVNQSDLLKLYFCCKELKKGVPIQYTIKQAEFYNTTFFVNNDVLIPRPETEELVDIILKENKHAVSFLDIGTGSGCIAISIKKNNLNSKVYACDVSAKALLIAKKNAKLNNIEVDFIETDILNVEESRVKIKYNVDVIISNPPYVKLEEKRTLNKHVIDYEPHLALFVNGQDDILFYKKIINLCEKKLNANGKLYFELNPLTAEGVLNYATESNLFKKIELIKDMSGKTRFLRAVKT